MLEHGPLRVLFERMDLPGFALPEALAKIYGGDLGFESPRLMANFVVSVDGVAALSERAESGHIISLDNAADRFVMGLLRACADAVIVGAGTFRKTPRALWNARAIYPAGAALFEEARSRLHLRPEPVLVLVTGSGEIDGSQPALRDAIVVTSPAGAERARNALPPTARVSVCGGLGGAMRMADVVQRLHAEGLGMLLAEGGPSTFARLVAERVVDELFLTVSPTLFGHYANDGRKSLVDGLDLSGSSLELMSVRQHRSHLFLRYAVHGR